MQFFWITSPKQMSNNYAPCFNIINFFVIPSYIELPCSNVSSFERPETFLFVLKRDEGTQVPNFSQFSGLYVKLLNRFEFVMITQFFIVILFFVFSNYFYFSYDRLFIYCDFYNCCDSFFISCCCGSCGSTFKHFLMNTNTLFLRILTR